MTALSEPGLLVPAQQTESQGSKLEEAWLGCGSGVRRTLVKSLHLSLPQFPQLESEDSDTYIRELLGESCS